MPAAAALPPDASLVFWLFFAIALLITAYFVFAELYHWLRFGFIYPLVWVAIPIYIIGTLVLIGGMLAGIAAIG